MLINIRKKDKKFRPWSTTVDDWYFDKNWLSREQMVEWLQNRAKKRHKEELKEIEDTFPNGYFQKNGRRMYFKNPKELKD